MSLTPRAFRSPNSQSLQSVPLHPAERALSGVLALWLLFLPWSLGTREIWAQWTSLGLAALAFVLALLPRRLAGYLHIAQPARVLARLPLFWMSIMLVAYVTIQALNPAWEWKSNDTYWWLEKRDYVKWLPHSVDAPMERMNPWRMLLIWSAPLLTVTAAWLGLTRRRSVQWLSVLVVLNAVAIAVLGMTQRLSGTEKIFWHYDFKHEVFGSFVYRNHGAQFLLLGLGLALGLGIRHYLHGLARGARSTPASIFAFFAIAIAAGIVVSTSRLGVVFGAGLVVLVLGIFAVNLCRAGLTQSVLPLVSAIVLVGFGIWFLSQVGMGRFFDRFQSLTKSEGEASLHIRISGAELGREMFWTQPLFGHGAGTYRHMEPSFTPNIPILPRLTRFYKGHHTVQHFRMRDAHNDHLQLLAEMGLIGCALIYGLLAGGLAALTSPLRRTHPVVYATLATALTILALAALDFPFVNAAILGTFALLFPLACRWADLERASKPVTDTPTSNPE